MIGVASIPNGGQQYGIYTCEGDTDKIFVIAIEQTANQGIDYYYRDDIILPDFERKNIDTLAIGNNVTNKYENIVTDPKIIDMIFALFNTPVTRELKGSVDVYDLNYMNSRYKGISILEFITAMDGRYWIVNWNYTNELYELPQDLLEELAGRQMPTASEYIAKYQ